MLYTSIRQRGLELRERISWEELLENEASSPTQYLRKAHKVDTLLLPQAKQRRPPGEYLENFTSAPGIWEM